MRFFQYLGTHEICLMDGVQSIVVNQGDEIVAGEALAAGLEKRTDFVEVQPQVVAPPVTDPEVRGRTEPEVQSTPTE